MNRFYRSMPPRSGDTFMDRVEHCITVLYVNGFMTETEKNNVRKRVRKDFAREEKKNETEKK